MNVVFVTLFLGLVAGPQDVRVAVGNNVAAVEVRLDGALAAELTAPEWKGSVDFGPDLLPHELEAVAFDREEHEVGRARIRVNLPRPLAEAAFVLDRPDQTGRQIARLTWQSAYSPDPRTARVTLDGEPLDARDLSRLEIPPGTPDRVRILRADLRFGNNVAATAEAFVGGTDRDYTSAELTAVPIVLRGRKGLPPLSNLAGWFTGGSGPLHVVAVEVGPADVVFLVDPDAEPSLRGMLPAASGEKSVFGFIRMLFMSAEEKRLNEALLLPEDAVAWLLLPRPFEPGGSPYSIFKMVGPLSRADGNVLQLYFRIASRAPDRDSRYLVHAAEATGLAAVPRARRRTAVWVLSDRALSNAPSFEPARQYLRALNVPLVVWRVTTDLKEEALPTGVIDASTPSALGAAISQLGKALEHQRIVWVEGNPLPQKIALTPEAIGIELAR